MICSMKIWMAIICATWSMMTTKISDWKRLDGYRSIVFRISNNTSRKPNWRDRIIIRHLQCWPSKCIRLWNWKIISLWFWRADWMCLIFNQMIFYWIQRNRWNSMKERSVIKAYSHSRTWCRLFIRTRINSRVWSIMKTVCWLDWWKTVWEGIHSQWGYSV